jgi:hypothetical protein
LIVFRVFTRLIIPGAGRLLGGGIFVGGALVVFVPGLTFPVGGLAPLAIFVAGFIARGFFWFAVGRLPVVSATGGVIGLQKLAERFGPLSFGGRTGTVRTARTTRLGPKRRDV